MFQFLKNDKSLKKDIRLIFSDCYCRLSCNTLVFFCCRLRFTSSKRGQRPPGGTNPAKRLSLSGVRIFHSDGKHQCEHSNKNECSSLRKDIFGTPEITTEE